MADVRIQYLADHGLAACIVGFWGYFIPRMGMDKVKKHWRYLVARWSAYPVVWCLAGEGTMPYYLSKTKEQDAETQKHGLTELARYVRATDPHQHPITIHPSNSGAGVRGRSVGARFRHASDRAQRPPERAQHYRDRESLTRRQP